MKLGLVLLCVVIPEMYTLQRYLEKLGLSSLASCFFWGGNQTFYFLFQRLERDPQAVLAAALSGIRSLSL